MPSFERICSCRIEGTVMQGALKWFIYTPFIAKSGVFPEDCIFIHGNVTFHKQHISALSLSTNVILYAMVGSVCENLFPFKINCSRVEKRSFPCKIQNKHNIQIRYR